MNRYIVGPILVTAAALMVGTAASATPTTTTTTMPAVKPVSTIPAAPARSLVQLSVGTSRTAADTLLAKANTTLKPTAFRVLTDTTAKKKTQYRVASACLTKTDAAALVKTAKAAGYTKAFASVSKSCKP
jgi:hypothetical protein